MMPRMKRLLAAVLCLVFISTAALADTAGLSRMAQAYLGGAQEVRFTVGADLKSLTPYGDGTIDMMNALLDYLTVEGSILDGGAATQLTFCAGDEALVSIKEEQADNGTMLTTSLLENRVLLSNGSAMDALSGWEQQETGFDFLLAIREAEACYLELAEAIQPYATEKDASYSIQNVGTGRWVRLARLTPEQSAEVQPLIAKLLGCGMDSAFREQLNGMVCQKSFTVALYRNKKDGNDIAMYIKGNVLFPDGQQRAISYQWAFGQNSKGQHVDTYKFDMTKTNAPRDTRQITGTAKVQASATALTIDVTSKAAIRDPETGITTTTTVTDKLNGKNGSIDGTHTTVVRDAIGETTSTTTTTVTPSLKVKVQDGVATLTGTARVQLTEGTSTTHADITLTFGASATEATAQQEGGARAAVVTRRQPPSSLTQNMEFSQAQPQDYLVGRPPIGYADYTAPKDETFVDLDSADETERAAILDELSQNLAGVLLRAVAKLPAEATALIRDNMSEADYAAFLEMLND